MPYLSYLSVFCPAAPTENASIQHERANTPREPRPRAWVRPRSCSRPTCRLRRRFDKPRSRAPSPPPPSFLSRSFVICLAIYPYYSYPPRSYHVSLYDGRYVDTRNRTQRRNGIFRCERYSSRIEKETERNGTSLGHVERRPRRKREREREEIVATVKRGRGVGYT